LFFKLVHFFVPPMIDHALNHLEIMRIISGKYRGRRLKSPPSPQTRPTSDRLRETLFNILAPRIKGARFLDLCAGSGAVGIEALSRGAAHTTFVDQSRRMCALIEANLDELKVDEDETEVVGREAGEFLRRHANKETAPFDIVYFDPPYATDYEAVLDYVGEHGAQLLAKDGLMIVEHHKKKELKEEFGSLQRYRSLKQGDSCLSFYSNAGSADVPSAQRA
jgi:16S rRNA (guanine966-N2)-methyltransferase